MESTVYIVAGQEFELKHHGIKGMKWGVRRFQKKDGSLTPAGKKRYYDTPELNRQKSEMESAKSVHKVSKRAYNKASTRYQNVPTASNREALESVQKKYLADNATYRHAKLKYETNKEVARIRDKGIEFKKKSKHRLELEDKYKKLGMTAEQAQAAANNRIRFEKTMATVAGLTVAVAATYATSKILNDRMDKVIKSGQALQRIEMRDTGGKLHDVFYAATGKHDTKRYYNLLGATRQRQTGEAYVMKLMAQKDVKVASNSKCRQVFQELWDNDSAFKEECRKRGIGLGSSKVTRRVYDEFNRELVDMHKSTAAKQFYDKLKASGYGAIQDINDKKYSGYAARKPLIIFDNSEGNIAVQSVKKITENLNKKGTAELGKATVETLVKESVETYGSVAAAATVVAATTVHYKDPTKQYKKGGTSKWR